MRNHTLSHTLSRFIFLVAGCAVGSTTLAASKLTDPIASDSLIFKEKNGQVAVEAEHFYKQTKTGKRAWYLTTAKQKFKAGNDADPSHVTGASGGAYLESLPDTRHHHGHKLINGENFSNFPGKLAILHYKIHFDTPGKYYVWVRAHSTGSEDNGIHVGLDGEWPESGQRMQWCEGKRTWWWEAKQRTEKNHCGEAYKIFLNIAKPGVHEITFSQREDGFEFDKFILTTKREFERPVAGAPTVLVKNGTVPPAFAVPAGYQDPPGKPVAKAPKKKNGSKQKPAVKKKASAPANAAGQFLVNGAVGTLRAAHFPTTQGTGYYLDQGKWMAISPEKRKSAATSEPFPFDNGRYDVTLFTVGENDGRSSYALAVGGEKIGAFVNPLSKKMYEEGQKYSVTWKNLQIKTADGIRVAAAIASEDGQEYSRARWSRVEFKRVDGKPAKVILARAPSGQTVTASVSKPIPSAPLVLPRKADGEGNVKISGELKQWHKVTLNLDGPFSHEQDNQPNPFTDYRMVVTFSHSSGTPKYVIPGYFAADGNAADSSAKSGTIWRAHVSPDKAGKWNYQISFVQSKNAAISGVKGKAVAGFNSKRGSFNVAKTDKTGRDLRGKGRLQYVGKRYLQFAGNKEYFLKAGADAPETFLGYVDFDDTVAGKPSRVPLKTWSKHVQDWRPGDPTWKRGKGKGMIGAINYLAAKGCNAFSFLPYNAGGDGDNVWPFTSRNDKFHYDCSKLDQWGIVFDHGTKLGHYLHFKLQETEMDDNRRGGHKGGNSAGKVPTSLDGGKLGNERKLYVRELVARFGHNLALNWNLGEENTQSTEEQTAMARYIHDVDPYDHLIALHTFPNQQDQVYRPLFGKKSKVSGFSLQNSNIRDSHWQVVKWVNESAKAGKPWVTAFDESGTAQYAQVPDLGYAGFNGFDKEGKKVHTQHDVRKYTLWGTLMGGGIGCEYYFGYKLAENDLVCEDWRSRDQSWGYCRIALNFFQDEKIPFWEMANADGLVGVNAKDNSRYCFAKTGSVYLVYLSNGGTSKLDLSKAKGQFRVKWFNPRKGGALRNGSVKLVSGGKFVSIGNPPSDKGQDWLAVIRR